MSVKVLLTTSLDPAYPEENMTDGSDDTFWLSTGKQSLSHFKFLFNNNYFKIFVFCSTVHQDY